LFLPVIYMEGMTFGLHWLVAHLTPAPPPASGQVNI
jgi:hypothetical protein